MPEASELKIFCLNEGCGDPAPNAGGKRKLRRMNYMGEDPISHVFQCPICDRTKRFKTEHGVLLETKVR